MSDLRLITILPPQPVLGVQQPHITGGQSQQINIVNFPVGSVLSGFIINRDASGNPILRTENGDITFASNFFLKIGSEITIRIEHMAGNTSAHILSINGEAPEIATAHTAATLDPEVIISGNLGGNKHENPLTHLSNAPLQNATQYTNSNSNSGRFSGGFSGATTSGADALIQTTNANFNANIAEKPIEINSVVTGKIIAPILTQENMPIIAAGSQISLKIISTTTAQSPHPATADITQTSPSPFQEIGNEKAIQNSEQVSGQNSGYSSINKNQFFAGIANNSPFSAYEKTASASFSPASQTENTINNGANIASNYESQTPKQDLPSPARNFSSPTVPASPTTSPTITNSVSQTASGASMLSQNSQAELILPNMILPETNSTIASTTIETATVANKNPTAINQESIINQSSSSPSMGAEKAISATSAFITTATPASANSPAPIETIQAGQQIAATVLNNQAGEEAIVQTPIGLIRVNLGAQTTAGSAVNFEILQIQTPEILETQNAALAAAINIAATTPAPITQLARSAGALGDIFSLLVGVGNSGNYDAQIFIENKIPSFSASSFSEATAKPAYFASANTLQPSAQPAPNLPIALLLFANALKNGDFKEWLGRGNAKWLEENGHENLLKKAEGEFASLARQFVDTPPHGWQSLFFPIAVDGQLQPIRLFTKRDREQKKDGETGRKTEEDTRFVLEMDLSNLGQMQMDGFVRRSNSENGAAKTQFDLIIRSHTPLSAQSQKDIMRIYNDTGELTGYSGVINFQTVKEFPVNPMEEISRETLGDMQIGINI